MHIYLICLILVVNIFNFNYADNVLGCGGFLKTHVQIDYAKVQVMLFTKQGTLKDKTNCAPNNGYYFLPLYDKGEYILKINPPAGWSFAPTEVELNVDGKTDLCSKSVDINFVFKGFGITGKVENIDGDGPSNVEVTLENKNEVRKAVTISGGSFFFTPVYPGKYVVKISHPRWKLLKQSVEVIVTEGNTELPPKSLVILGYDVTGLVMSGSDPISNVNIILFPQHDEDIKKISANNCDKSDLSGFNSQSKALCHVSTNDNGIYVFPSLSPGNYRLVPFYKSENIHFEPAQIDFTLISDSYKIETIFTIKGITVTGRIISSVKGNGVENAIIYVDGIAVTTTNTNGYFQLEQWKTGQYAIKVEADDLLFQDQIVTINPTIRNLEDIIASGFKVCGVVVNEKSFDVHFTNIDTSETSIVTTQPGTGKFCQILKCGKYKVQVLVDEEKLAEGVQFFPISQTIDVKNPIHDLTFSQLKAEVTGKVKCLRKQDCESIKVILTCANDVEIVSSLTSEGLYNFKDIRPGNIILSLSANKLCWEGILKEITVVSTVAKIPDFIQIGYELLVSSSHSTQLIHNPVNGSDKESFTWDIRAGTTTHCLKHFGSYNLKTSGCHQYDKNEVIYDTDNNGDNLITLTAVKHLVNVEILTQEIIPDVYMLIKEHMKDTAISKNIKKNNKGYQFQIYLDEKAMVNVEPKSEIFWFNPTEILIDNVNDCITWNKKFTAVRGKIISGNIKPPIKDVKITIEVDSTIVAETMTDEFGSYKFQPLNNQMEYKVSAQRDSFVFSGPDENGNFLAHKLAEVQVEIVDKSSNEPLQGTLLSLSGGDRYRSNLLTNAEGKMIFHSLSPGDYFLRPMMKEYNFEPNSQLISVKEGQTVTVKMMGKRVAFSVMGSVTSLNGEPENNVLVVARGVGNCSHYSEETITEVNGQFRIRGLQPYCSYILSVSGPTENATIYSISEKYTLNVIKGDLSGIKLVVIHPSPKIDIAVHIYTEKVDQYKSIRLKLLKEGPSNSVIHLIKLDNYKMDGVHNPGVIAYFPPLLLDSKTYVVQAETTSQSGAFRPNHFSIVANESFHMIYLEYLPQIDSKEQHIKQTSVWALLLIFVAILVFYNIEQVAQITKSNVGKIASSLPTARFSRQATVSEHIYNDDLDQIVQNINAPKKKIKSRKT